MILVLVRSLLKQCIDPRFESESKGNLARSLRPAQDTRPTASDSAVQKTPDRIPYFVPMQGIDVEPLAMYVRGILDNDAEIRIGVHP